MRGRLVLQYLSYSYDQTRFGQQLDPGHQRIADGEFHGNPRCQRLSKERYVG
jgi:hypothetical protein